MGSLDMPRALRDKLKEKSAGGNMPAALRQSPVADEEDKKKDQSVTVAPPPVAPSTTAQQPEPQPLLKRFSDIFSADNILDRDLASSHAINLNSVNNTPSSNLSLTGFNEQRASENPLTPSFEEKRNSDIGVIKKDPKALRDYRKKRVSEIDESIAKTKDRMLSKVDPATYMGGLALPSVDPSTYISPQEIKDQEDYKNELQKSIATTAAVIVPKSFYDNAQKTGQGINIEEVGKRFLETVGYGALKDDEKVLSKLMAAKIDEEDKPIAELTSQTIRNKFYKEGAAALSAYHIHEAEELQRIYPEKVRAYTTLLANIKAAKTTEEKARLQSSIDAALLDPVIKSFANDAEDAIRYSDESATSSRLFPQVLREEKRQQLNDLYFKMEDKRMEDRATSWNPLSKVRVALSAIFGEDPDFEDMKSLAKQTGMSEEEVTSLITEGKKGLFAKSNKGVRVGGALTGISQAADETLAASLMGIRRLLNVEDVDTKNALLKTKSEGYNSVASQNMLFDKSGKLNINPFSIFNTAGRGIGQMAIFAAPTLVSGGIASGAGVALGIDGSAVSGAVTKGVEMATTHAAGYIGSYESAYKDIAAYTDNEEVRRGYANVVAHANAGAEHLMSPADVVKMMGVGAVSKEMAIKTFIKDAEKLGLEATIGRRLGKGLLKAGEVGLAEIVEENATNAVTNLADLAYMNKNRSAAELADQFWQTSVTTAVNMLPMMVGAGMSGANDISNIRKEALFEAGNEPEVIKDRLKALLDNNDLSQEKYNTRLSVVNTMQNIVSKVDKLTKSDGSALSYDEKVIIAAQQYRIAHNNKLKSDGAIQAQEAQVDADNKEAISEQQAIIDSAPLYKINGKVVDVKDVNDVISSGDKSSIVEIKNDEELSKKLQDSRNEVQVNPAPKEVTIQDAIDKKVSYNGMSGTIVRDGMQYVFQQDDSNKEYVIEPEDDYESKPVADLGIHIIEEPAPEPIVEDKSGKKAEAIQAKINVGEPLTEEEEKNKKLYELSGRKFTETPVSEVSLNDDNSFTIRGKKYVNNFSDPFQAINRDENGYVNSVNLEDENGKKRTFRGDAANDIAYQMNLKEITKDNATREQFEEFINTDDETVREIESATVSKITEASPVENNGEIQEITASSSGDSSKTDIPTNNGEISRDDTEISLYDNSDTFKTAFEALSPEDKVRYSSLIENDQHDEADALLTSGSVHNKESAISVGENSVAVDISGEGVSVEDQEAVKSLTESLANEPYKASLVKRANIVFSVLKKLIPHVEIYLHTTSKSFNDALGSLGIKVKAEGNFSFGVINGKPLSRIDIDLSVARLGIIAHEATHAVLQHIFPNQPETFNSFKSRLEKIIEKSTDKYLNKFINQYKDEDVRPEEYLAELSAVVQTNNKAIKPTIIYSIKKLINIVTTKALGISVSPETESIESVRDFFNSMNTAFTTGNVNADELVSKANKASSTTALAASSKREVSSRARLIDKAENENKNEGLEVNKTGATQGFFSDVVSGKSDKFKPKKEWKPVLKIDKSQEKFAGVFNKYKGNFDMHIATSIPTFRELQVKVGNAISNTFGQPLKKVDENLLKLKENYNKKFNVKTEQVGLKTFDTDFFKSIADLHDNTKDTRNSPAVIKTYRAFMKETRAMYDALVAAGYTMEPYLGEGEPYGVDSNAVRKDIQENKHLYYLQSRSATGQGEEALSGDDYILFESTGIVLNGQDVVYNDLFRAVHDVIGHGTLSNSTFSSQGEFNAYLTHSNMYSPEAQKALFLETVSYNAWYNFGGHLRREDGTIPAKGDIDFDPNKRVYAPRKLYDIPDRFINEARRSPLVYDIGGSEGGFVKAITEHTNGSIKTINLDVNPDMKKAHEKKPVKGSEFILEAFYEGYTDEDSGVEYKRHLPAQRADLVHESMVFQFISPERTQFINEVADNYLNDNGVLMLEEKVTPDSNEEWVANEKKKDGYKLQYYPQEAITEKAEQVLVGMKANQTAEADLLKALSGKFKFVSQYWDSGNFKGYMASNSKEKIDRLTKAIGDTKSEFTSRPNFIEIRDGRKVKGDSIINRANVAAMESELELLKETDASGQTFNSDGSVYNPSSDGNPDVVTLASFNVPVNEISPEVIEEHAQGFSEFFMSVPQAKIGVFKLSDTEMSVDFNVITDKKNRGNSVQFAAQNNQDSIFSYDEGEAIKTGGNGATVIVEPEYVAQAANAVVSGTPFNFDGIKSRQSLTALPFEQRKKRLDVAKSVGALSEEQYQKSLDKAITSTGTNPSDVLTKEEQEAYDNFFKRNAKPISLKERVSNIVIPDTDISSPYSANKTFEKAGFGNKGRPAQGNTTTIKLMVQANIDFISQYISETQDGVRNLLEYLGYSENQGKLARDFNMEGLKTLNDYRLANVLFAYIHQSPLSELGISPEQSKRYTMYLKKFSSELGREIGQSLNTAKIRKVTNAVVDDMILESMLSASEYNAISEAEEAMVNILSGQGESMSDEELVASEEGLLKNEEENEKESKQSSLLSKLIGLIRRKEQVEGEVTEKQSSRIIERINKQIAKTSKDIKDIINNIKCD